MSSLYLFLQDLLTALPALLGSSSSHNKTFFGVLVVSAGQVSKYYYYSRKQCSKSQLLSPIIALIIFHSMSGLLKVIHSF